MYGLPQVVKIENDKIKLHKSKFGKDPAPINLGPWRHQTSPLKSLLLRITLHELGFTLPPTQIKTDNSAAEGIVTAVVKQKSSKAMDIRFYWMKDRVKQKDLFVYWKPGFQNMGG